MFCVPNNKIQCHKYPGSAKRVSSRLFLPSVCNCHQRVPTTLSDLKPVRTYHSRNPGAMAKQNLNVSQVFWFLSGIVELVNSDSKDGSASVAPNNIAI